VAGPYDTVVIPGFGGTQLVYQGGRGGRTSYWYNPVIMATKNPLFGALAGDGISPYPILGGKLSPAGPVDMGIYEPLLTSLANGGRKAVFWGYDWRLSAAALDAQLALFLTRTNLTNPFSVVAHSYGGVIAQLAYQRYQTLSPAALWAKTIYLGTPHGGSYWAAAALAGYFPVGSELAPIPAIFDLLVPGLSTLKATTYSTALLLLGQLFGSWPGLYCCLPNATGPWKLDDTDAGQLSDIAAYAHTWGGQQQQWFLLSQQIQALISAGLENPRPSEYCLVGTGVPTLGLYDSPGNPGDPLSYESTTQGDGTVTLHRASLPSPAIPFEYAPLGHNQLVTGAQPNATVLQILGSSTIGSSTVTVAGPPATFLPNPPLPPVGRLVFPAQANATGDP
jgi:pimeloyl-ACP methyl ester carboxylesterase